MAIVKVMKQLLALLVLHAATAAALPAAAMPCSSLPPDAVVGSAVPGGDGKLSFVEGVVPGAVASGVYVDSAHTRSDFGKLRVVTAAAAGASDAEQMRAAGFVEGFLTAARINDHHANLRRYFAEQLNATRLPEAMAWVKEQERWLRARVAAAAAAEAAGAAARQPQPPPPQQQQQQPRADADDDGASGSSSGGGDGDDGSPSYWRVVGLMLAQLDGLHEGYDAAMDAAAAAASAGAAGGSAGAAVGGAAGGAGAGPRQQQQQQQQQEERLTRDDLAFLNANGELYDILDMLDARDDAAAAGGEGGGSGATGWRRLGAMRPEQLLMDVGLRGHCSAFLKITPDLQDLLVGHSTWDSYCTQTRVFKHYEFLGLQEPSARAKRLSFSSYPGEVFSDDDLYLTSAGLVVLETTNHVFDTSILAALSPRTVPSWARVRAANLVADSGAAWLDVFSRHNSGTYNNQYMVLDLKRFAPGKELRNGTLWVVEQLPGMIEASDETETLARGYWASYNVPASPRIAQRAGYPSFLAKLDAKGPHYDQPKRWLQYQAAPRATIFRRDQGSVKDLEGAKALARYNDWRRDPLSGGHPVAAVASRGDLAPPPFEAIPKGAYDSKVTSLGLALRMEAEVIGGPTQSHGQPPFTWADPRWAKYAHRGMRTTYDGLEWERQSAAQLPLPGLECNGGGGGGDQRRRRQQQQQQRRVVEQ